MRWIPLASLALLLATGCGGNNSAPPKKKTGIIGKTTDVVVDAQKALEDPDLELASTKIQGSDPLTQSSSAYFTLAPKAGTLGMQQMVQTHKALNDRYPTYDEFMKMMTDNGVTFPMLREFETYSYDAETGKIAVLLNTKKKKASREKLRK